MGDKKWKVTASAKVRGDSQSVVGWFTHPDRIDESIAKLKVTDMSVEESLTDSARVREVRCKTSRGSLLYARVESDLGPDGHIGTWSGDRFLLARRGLTERRSTSGDLRSIMGWNEIMTFDSIGQGETEVNGTNDAESVEPDWHERLLHPIIGRTVYKRRLRDLANRCEQALRTP